MIYDADKFTDYLVKLQLTPTQFYLCWLIDNRDYNNLKKYINGNGMFDSKDFEYLIDKGYILNTNPKGHYDASSLVVTLEFREMMVEPEDAFQELLDAYPPRVIVNGTTYSSTSLTFSDEKAAREAYSRFIKKNRYLHAEIISLIGEMNRETGGVAPFKIDKFITGRYWDILKQSKEQNVKPHFY